MKSSQLSSINQSKLLYIINQTHMLVWFGHHIQIRTYLLLNQFKDVLQDLFSKATLPLLSVTEMLQRLNWNPLVHCQNQLKAITMFKIIHNLIDIPANTHLIPLSSDHNTCGHQWRFKQPMTRINSYLHSFFLSAIKIWNPQSDDIVSSTTLNQKLAGLDMNL